MAKLLKFCVLLLLTVFISACGGGGGNASAPSSTGTTTTTALYSTAPDALAMSVGSAQEFTIAGGTSPYTAVSNDMGIAVAAVSSSKLTIGGVTSGEAKIQIRDGVGASISVPVTVKSAATRALYTTSPSSITITAGNSDAQTYRVGGGVGPYTATSANPGVVSVVFSSDRITVTGISAGSAGIVVMDSLGAMVTIAATIPAAAKLDMFTTAPSGISVTKDARLVYSIGGGTAPYSATSSNVGVADVSVSERSLTVNGLSAGNASLVVRDSVGATVTIAVSVPTGATTSLYTTAPTSVNVAIAAAPEYVIGGGTEPYSATSSNASVARVSLSGRTLTVTGISAGSASVVVRDVAGATVAVAVTVPTGVLYTTAPSSITVAVGEGPGYSIGGGNGSYTATTSNASVATVAVLNSNLTINAISAGSASVVVRDSSNATVTISVTVPTRTSVALFTTAPSSFTVASGSSTVYTISGGSPPYTATSTNSAIASVILSVDSFTVNGSALGKANIGIRDQTGANLTVEVSVATPTLIVTPNTATAIIDDPLLATITGGKVPYSAVVGNTLVAKVSIINGNQLSVKPVQTGQTIITVLDALNQSVAYSLTVNAATPGIRLSPSVLTISELSTGTFELLVYGAATGEISAFSSNLALLNTSVTSNKVTLATGSNGDRCVLVNTPVTISVLDSTRAIGTATVTIENNSSSCPAVTVVTALYTTAPSSISLAVSESPTYTISGGTASYSATSSNTSVATVTLTGTAFTVKGIRAGTANIVVTDAVGAAVTIAVTVP